MQMSSTPHKAWSMQENYVAPMGFRPAGEVRAAFWSPVQKDVPRSDLGLVASGSRSQRAGRRFESRVQSLLVGAWAQLEYVPGPWISFTTNETPNTRRCQPDGLLVNRDKGVVLCVEVKHAHTPDAWFQVRRLYQPVLAKLFDGFRFTCVEIVKTLDLSRGFPEVTLVVESLDELMAHAWTGEPHFMVHKITL